MRSAPTRPHTGHVTSLGRRLVRGGGVATAVAYHDDPERVIPVLVHGVGAGELFVAVPGAEAGRLGGSVDMRLDIHREATEVQFRIAASSAHALARVEWLDRAGLARRLGDGALPAEVAWAARCAGAAVGVARTERLVVHCGHGVVGRDARGLLADGAVFPSRAEEVSAHDAVAAAGPGVLAELVRAVADGRVPGGVLAQRHAPVASPCAVGRVFCVDVDRHGLTLMRVGADGAVIAFAEFGAPVSGPAGLDAALAALRAEARC